MKKLICILTAILMITLTTGCSKANLSAFHKEPDIKEIQHICKLATIECNFSNVAKYQIPKDNGPKGLIQPNAKVWVEYQIPVEIGIDLKKVEMKVNNNDITITLPKAEIIELKESKYDDKDIYKSCDGIISSFTIESEDVSKAITESKKDLEKCINDNDELLDCARERAKILIENYISSIEKATGKEYNIEWKDNLNIKDSNEE